MRWGLLVGLSACHPNPPFGLEIGENILGLIWFYEPHEGEAEILAVARESFAEYDRRIGAKDRVTVLAYEHDLESDLIPPGPLERVAENAPGRDLPAPDEIYSFDPDAAQWRRLAEISEPLASVRVPPFDFGRCADTGGCLTGDPMSCTLPCPIPTPPMSPDPPAEPAPPSDVPAPSPPRAACAGELVQWFGASDCAPIDVCPVEIPAGAIRVEAPDRIGDALLGAAPGTIVAVGPGVFLESILIPVGVRVLGACARDTKLGTVLLASGAAIEHVELTSVHVDGFATGAAIRFVLVASSTTNAVVNEGMRTTIDRLVVRDPDAISAVLDAGTASISNVVIEGGRLGLSCRRSETTLTNIAIRDTSTAAIAALAGAAVSIRGLSIESDEGTGLHVADSSLSASDLAIGGALEPLAIGRSEVTLERGLFVSGGGSGSDRSRLEMTNTRWESGGARALGSRGSTITVARSHFLVGRTADAAITAEASLLVLADVACTGGGLVVIASNTTIDRASIEGSGLHCVTSLELGELVLRDLSIRESSCVGVGADGAVEIARILADLPEGTVIALESPGEEPLETRAVIESLDVTGSEVGVVIQERSMTVEIRKSRIVSSEYGIIGEQATQLQIEDLELEGIAVGLEVDSTSLMSVERFALLGTGNAGAQVVGNFAPSLDGRATGLALRDGRIGAAYRVGVSFQASDYDPTTLLDHVTILARPSLEVGSQ